MSTINPTAINTTNPADGVAADKAEFRAFRQAVKDQFAAAKVDIDGLEAGGSTAAHTHPISDVTGLQTALDGKAATAHTHAIADTTGLQAALDGKAATTHGHADATASAAGFMSAADKTKLDGLSQSNIPATITHTLLYAAGAYPARPASGFAIFIGPDDPGLAMVNGDQWIDTDAP